MPLPDFEDPVWNKKREALEQEFQNCALRLLDHMGWPGSIIIPMNTVEMTITFKPRSAGNAN